MMKKILYGFVALSGLWLSSCSEVDNLAGGGDTSPAVTIYSYAIPVGTDEDATVNLRIVPNTLCDKFYVLAEKKADKEAFIAANGADAYAARVVANGTQYAAEPTSVVNETLAATYAVTAVGVTADGTTGKPFEFIFNGVEWGLIGTASYSDLSFNPVENQSAQWYKSLNLETVRYKLEVTMAAWDNYQRIIKLNWDDTGKLTFYNGTASPSAGYWRFPTPFNHATYGAYLQEVDLNVKASFYNAETSSIHLETRRAVSAGTFAGWYPVDIALPPQPW